MTIDAIHEFLQTKTTLASSKVTIKDVADLISTVRAQNISEAEFINFYQSITKAGLTPVNLKTTLDYKAQLEDLGFRLNDLGLISKTAKDLKLNPQHLLEASHKYEGITKLEAALNDLQTKNRQASEQFSKKTDEIKKSENSLAELNIKIESARGTLQALDGVTKLGYDTQTLQTLAAAATTLGGITQVLTAVNEYGSLVNLRGDIQKLDDEKTKLEKEKTAMETRNLRTSISSNFQSQN